MEKSKRRGGRAKGTPNKRSPEIKEIFDKMGFDPAEGLAWAFGEAVKLYKARLRRGTTWGAGEALGIAGKIANDAAQYVYPKRKAVEHTGANGEPLMKSFAEFIVALDPHDLPGSDDAPEGEE